jgi:hypothetical protein
MKKLPLKGTKIKVMLCVEQLSSLGAPASTLVSPAEISAG